MYATIPVPFPAIGWALEVENTVNWIRSLDDKPYLDQLFHPTSCLNEGPHFTGWTRPGGAQHSGTATPGGGGFLHLPWMERLVDD